MIGTFVGTLLGGRVGVFKGDFVDDSDRNLEGEGVGADEIVGTNVWE